MYKISVPIMNDSVDMNTRDVYLKQMNAGHVDRVFLVVVALPENEAETEKLLLRLRDNIAFFEQNGIEAGIWFAETIGHGGALAVPGTETRRKTETPLMNLSGEQILGTHCPLDRDFRRRIAGQIARLAQTGVKTILLDDDFRLSVHGLENKYLCACDLHMAKIRRFCGEDISREELEAKVFRQKANKYRAAWLRAQGESLRLLAEDIRAEMDKAAPDVRIAYCTAPTWDIDGCSPIELSRVLGGKNPPLARLSGAPYWAVLDNRPLSTVFETARMYASFCKGSGLELMAEGDVYPRPRHIVPASYLELYDAVIRADGQYHGILKYMVGYTTSPKYETGYINRHISDLQRMEQISGLFAGKTACGVGVPVHPHQFDDADFSLGVVSSRYPYALAGSMLASLSIPTTYENNGVCPAIFGEEARHIPAERLKKGAILDGVAAVLLTERGIDVGLSGEQHFEKIRVRYIVSPDGAERVPLNWRNDGARQMRTELSAGAEVVLSAEVNGERSPMVYRYQNASGQRFTVFLADTMAMQYTSDLRRGDLMQDVMLSAAEWISGEKLPAVCPHNPDLYLLCKQGDGKLAVGLFNCFADSILEPVITLDRNYSSIRFVGCDGRLEGNQVHLNSPLNAFEFAAFEVTLREAEEHPE